MTRRRLISLFPFLASLPFFAKSRLAVESESAEIHPSTNQDIIEKVIEEWDKRLSFKKNHTFFFRNRGGQSLFARYDTMTGNPVCSMVLYVIWAKTVEGAGIDLEGGPLPNCNQLMECKMGTRIFGIGFGMASSNPNGLAVDTHARIREAVSIVQSNRTADVYSDQGFKNQEHWMNRQPGQYIKGKFNPKLAVREQ